LSHAAIFLYEINPKERTEAEELASLKQSWEGDQKSKAQLSAWIAFITRRFVSISRSAFEP
jgi:hypothetical protein